MNSKWLNTNTDVACNRIINKTDVAELRNIGYACIKSDVNGRIKLAAYNWKFGRGK